MPSSEAEEIVAFWREAGPTKWFAKDEAFDASIRERFGALVDRAAAGRLSAWQDEASGALALLLLTDQFPRNLFRGRARAFATDEMARAVAARALENGFDAEVDKSMRGFFYLPFMHSENLADQERCVSLFKALGDGNALKFAVDHRDIIARFGRFPHRNPALGREMTAEETEFLKGDVFKG